MSEENLAPAMEELTEGHSLEETFLEETFLEAVGDA